MEQPGHAHVPWLGYHGLQIPEKRKSKQAQPQVSRDTAVSQQKVTGDTSAEDLKLSG